MLEPMRACYSVWRFRGVTISQEVIVVRRSEPFEPQSEYQQVLWRGLAWGPVDARGRYESGKESSPHRQGPP